MQAVELVPLESHEWSTRWEQLVAARQTPKQVAESLARAFDAAADASARSLIIARATRRGVLEHLQALRPDSLQVSLALALERLRQGRHIDLERLRREVFNQLREMTAKGPVDPSLFTFIAQLLTEDAPHGRWVSLDPTE